MDDTAQNQNIPIATPKKEQEPRQGGAGSYIEKVERKPELPPEVIKVGIAPVSGPTLKKEDKEIGLVETGENISVRTQPEGLVTLPLTEEEAKKSSRGSVSDAIVWLANFVLRQFKILKTKGKYAG